mgnify:FL=1
MSPPVEFALSGLAWLITLIRVHIVLKSRLWKSDPKAFRVWVATLFFALTMTFLITPLSIAFNRLTFPNLSRLLAYSFVSTTLYLLASASLVNFPIAHSQRMIRLLKLSLIPTLFLLLVLYVFFVSGVPEWNEKIIPSSAAEAAFKLVLFTFATAACLIIVATTASYFHREQVTVTRYRIVTIILTSTSASAFFLTKLVLTLGYLWPVLGASWIHRASTLLEIMTAILWVASFLHSSAYVRAFAMLRGLRSWHVYRDLLVLIDQLEQVCPPVGMALQKAGFWGFVRNSDYHLYRAIVHILDGKTLIADFLANPDADNAVQARWDEREYLKASSLNELLEEIQPTDDFTEMVAAYRLAGRKLIGATP